MSVAEYFAQAQEQIAQQKWQEASESFQNIIKLEPNLWEANFNLGQVLSQQQKYEEAIQAYKNAIALNKNYADSYNNLGIILLYLKRFQESKNYFSQAINLDSKNPWLYRNLAQALIRQGQEIQALNCLEQAVKLKPDSPELQVFLGETLRNQGSIKAAVNCFCRALKINYNYIPAYTALKFTQLESTWVEEIIAFYQEIIEKNPDLVAALTNLADLLTQQGKIKDAITYYQTSIYKKTLSLNPQLENSNWATKKSQAPDFLIIGAGKCGTTSLFSYLEHHPKIFLPNNKEINFFSKNFTYGLDWYLSQFPTITDSSKYLTGEASPSYFFMPDVPERIYQLAPNIKLIVLLRNPIYRTISAYYQNKKTGKINKSLAELVAREIKHYRKIEQDELSYAGGIVLQSLYFWKLKRWLKTFSHKQFLILRSEDFFEYPAQTMRQVFQFLEIPEVINQHYYKLNIGTYPPIDEATKQRLTKFFHKHNQKLEKYLKREFHWD